MKMEYRYAGMDILYQLVLIRTETVREKGALKSVRKPAYDAVQTMDQFGFRRRAAAALSKDQKIPVQISGISAGTLDQAFGRQFAVGNGRGFTYRLRADGAAGQTGFRGHKRTQNGWNRLLWLKFPGFQRKKRDWRNRPG